jgi:hypothetical protein
MGCWSGSQVKRVYQEIFLIGQNMKQKIITTLIECTLAIIIFGGWGVLLAWRG